MPSWFREEEIQADMPIWFREEDIKADMPRVEIPREDPQLTCSLIFFCFQCFVLY